MFRKLPLGYKVVFILSVVAATLSIPTMALVVADLIEQDDWRTEETASLCRIESLLMGRGTVDC